METCKRITSERIAATCRECKRDIVGFVHVVDVEPPNGPTRFYCADHCPVHKDVNQLTAALKEASDGA